MRDIKEIASNTLINIAEIDDEGFYAHIRMGGNSKLNGSLQVSWSAGWEHASFTPNKRYYYVNQDEMRRLKNMIWNENETAVVYVPARSYDVSFLDNCVHLWRPTGIGMPMPHRCFVAPYKDWEKDVPKAYAEPYKFDDKVVEKL